MDKLMLKFIKDFT